MLPLHLALIADLWIFVVGLVGCYLLLAPTVQAVPAWSISIVEIKVRNVAFSYARRREYASQY